MSYAKGDDACGMIHVRVHLKTCSPERHGQSWQKAACPTYCTMAPEDLSIFFRVPPWQNAAPAPSPSKYAALLNE